MHASRLVPWLVVFACGCSAIETEKPLPADGYEFYTGSDEGQGDVYLGTTELTHPETGTTVVLVPMVHIADAQYYRTVQTEMDTADVVLVEGIGRSSNLGPTKLVVTYLLANYPRWAALGGFTEQNEVLHYGDNARSGDLSLEQFKESMPWYTPAVQLAVFPVLVVGAEVFNAVSYVHETLSWPLFSHDAYEAGFRQVFAMALFVDDGESDEDDDEGDDEGLLPGVRETRNAHLLTLVDEIAAQRGKQRIVLPWGSAHMDGLEKSLIERGYAKTAHRWQLAMKVKKLHDGVTPYDDDRAFDFYVPFALQWRKLDEACSLSMLFHSIAWHHGPDSDDSVSLLWDMLFTWGESDRKDAVDWQLLPSLFDRPIVFAYDRKGPAKRVRFLMFGNVTWGDEP